MLEILLGLKEQTGLSIRARGKENHAQCLQQARDHRRGSAYHTPCLLEAACHTGIHTVHQHNSCKAVHCGKSMHPCKAQYLPGVAGSATCPGTRKVHLEGAGAALGIREETAAGETPEEGRRSRGRKGRRLRVVVRTAAGRGTPCRAEGALGSQGEGPRLGDLLPASPEEGHGRV